MTCDKAPKGWNCTRGIGHDGPCAAVKAPWWARLAAAFGTALGNAKFGG
jgi:hypothetical protein